MIPHSPSLISLAEFSKIAQSAPRSVLIMRHAERPPIAKDDPTFGKHLKLTLAGNEMALNAGRILTSLPNCCYGATPTTRTHETVRLIAQGMGRGNAHIFDVQEVGLNGFWITDIDKMHSIYHDIGSDVATDRYFEQGKLPGIISISEGTQKTVEWIKSTTFPEKCAIIVSHDIFIAAILQGLGVQNFNSRNWAGYLHGAAFIQSSTGMWTAAYCVPDPTQLHQKFNQ